MRPRYRLPEHLRPLLAEPFGPVHDTPGALLAVKDRVVVSVGDVVTQMFLDAGVLPQVMLVDGVTQRGSKVEHALARLPPTGVRRVMVENPAATLTSELLDALERGLRAPEATLIEVVGEEDLAALPAMILAPDGAAVCYGQPRRGVVVVVITPEVRTRAREILTKME